MPNFQFCLSKNQLKWNFYYCCNFFTFLKILCNEKSRKLFFHAKMSLMHSSIQKYGNFPWYFFFQLSGNISNLCFMLWEIKIKPLQVFLEKRSCTLSLRNVWKIYLKSLFVWVIFKSQVSEIIIIIIFNLFYNTLKITEYELLTKTCWGRFSRFSTMVCVLQILERAVMKW